MLEYMVNFFVSGFVYPGILWNQVLLGIGLAIVFGAIWFIPYWTPILKKPWAWAVLASGAFFELGCCRRYSNPPSTFGWTSIEPLLEPGNSNALAPSCRDTPDTPQRTSSRGVKTGTSSCLLVA